ncbi:MAG: PTH1 family peptidyl-tRNA hydrolase [Saprospiraceae bacterium]|jgi:PTH1 family peptidyl-tRNA hydrolase
MLEWLRRLFAFNKEEEMEDPMKYLVAGLGNIGGEYHNTRHNIGFDVVDYLADQHEGKWKTDTLGDVCEIKHKGRTIVLLKPSTFMNRSGKAVNYWMTKKKIEKENLLVIVDDLHLELGKLRLRGKGSDGGHNGLRDIQQVLGGSNYPRLKFGIGNNFHSGQQVDFVLGKWTNEEQDKLQKVIKKAADATKSFATIGIKFTMEQFNR